MKIFKNILPALILTGLLLYNLYFNEPPKSWFEATIPQILFIFIPILLIPTFILNLFLNYLPKSLTLGLGIMMISLLQALEKLSILSALLIILVTILLYRFIPKKRVTRTPKIPKLKKL